MPFYITHILIFRSFSKAIRSNYPKVIYNTPKNIKINYKVVVGHEDKSKELYILGKATLPRIKRLLKEFYQNIITVEV